MSNRNRHLYQYHSEAFESSRAENEQAVQSAAAVKAEMGKRHEIKSLRTANTKTFENQDHTITKSIYLEDIHYQDEDGSWQEMDDTLAVQVMHEGAVPGAETEGLHASGDGNTMASTAGQAAAQPTESSGLRQFTNRKGAWQAAFPAKLGSGGDVQEQSMSQADQEDSMSCQPAKTESQAGMETENPTAAAVSAGMFSMRDGKDILSWCLEGAAAVEAEQEKGRVVYHDILQDTDLSCLVRGTRVKEDIILKSPDAPEDFTYLYHLNGLAAVQDGREVGFCDKDGKEIFRLSAPLMRDAAGEVSEKIAVRVMDADETGDIPPESAAKPEADIQPAEDYEVPAGDKETPVKESGIGMPERPEYVEKKAVNLCHIAILPDKSWLASPDRVYPVTIDPVTTSSLQTSQIYDACVDAENPGTNYLTQMILKTRGGKKPQRSFIRFTLPAIRTGDMVTQALLVMTPLLTGTVNRTISVHKVRQEWESSSVTWDNAPVFEDEPEDIRTFHGFTNGAGNITLDITSMVKEWYRDGNNYGLLVKDLAETGNAASDLYTPYMASDNVDDWKDIRPHIAISYVNYSGLEDFWNYHTQDAGRAGEVHVNDYNGNLVFRHPVLDTDGSRMPMDLVLTWNSNDKDTNIGYGKGFRLNYHQKVEKHTIAGTDYYRHTEGDGTVHYFFYDTSDASNKRWTDEMTRDLTLTINSSSADRYVISDKDGNKQVFNTAGYLVREEDANGNTLSITYTQDRITKVVDGAGRSAVIAYQMDGNTYRNIHSATLYAAGGTTALKTKSFTYSGTAIIQTTEFDGTHCYFTYDNRNLLTEVRTRDGRKLAYAYGARMPYRVSEVTEYGTSGNNEVEGNTLTFAYGVNTTKVTDRKGRPEILCFDNAGKLLHVQDGFGHALSAGYDTGGAKKLKNVTRLQATAVQLLSDPAVMLAETASPWKKSVSGTGNASVASGSSVIGSNALKAACTSDAGEAHWKQDVTVAKGKTYTFSMYVKADITSAASDGYARIHVTYKDASGTAKYPSSRKVKASTSGFERFSVTFTLPSGATSDSVTCWLDLYHAKGTVWGDMAQLETGNTCSRVNLVDNGSFQKGNLSGFTKTGTASDKLVTAGAEVTKPGYRGLITTKTATLRQEPNASAAAVTTIAANTRLYGSYVSGSWYRAETAAGQKGWVQASEAAVSFAGSVAEKNGNGFPVPGNSYFQLYSAANPSSAKILEAGPSGVRLVVHESSTGTDGKTWYHVTAMVIGNRYTGYAPTEAVMRQVRDNISVTTKNAAVMYALPSTASANKGTKAAGTSVKVRGIVSTAAGNFYGILSGKTYVFLREADLNITANNVMTAANPVSAVHAPAAIDGLDSHMFFFAGDRTADKKLMKTLSISGVKDDAFLVNAWGMGHFLPKMDGDAEHSSRHFGVEVTFIHTDNSTESFHADFCAARTDWQFLSAVFLPTKAYKEVKVGYAFCRQEGWGFVDGLSLYREEYGQSYTYDSKGNVVSAVDAARQSSAFTYNSNQDLTGLTDPRGNSFTYDYDNKHNVKKGVSASGVRTDLLYDSHGNITYSGTTDPSAIVNGSGGNVDPDQTTGMWVKRTFTSDGNHASSIRDAAGNTVSYSWDTGRDRMNAVTDPKGTVTSYTYDAMDRVTKVSQAIEGSQKVENTYTYTDDKLASIGHNGFQYGFSYDAYGNTTAVSIAGTNVVAYQYEANNGNLLKAVYANGDTLRNAYDTQDRVTGVYLTKTGGTEQKLFTYTYDREGTLAAVKDEVLNKTTNLYYDLLGRLCQAECSDGTGYRYTYDANNNMTALKSTAEATFSTAYTYDTDNRERTVKAYGHTRTTHYDKLGRVTERNWDETTANGTTTAMHKTIYRYFDTDAHKRWNQVRQVMVDGVNTSYTYDANGNIATIADSGGTRRYFYDKRNQLVREDDPVQGKTIMYTYDLGGNMTSQKEYAYTTAATVSGTPAKAITATYPSTGWKDRLLSWDGQAITYDAAGNMLKKGSTTYTWIRGRRLASAVKGGTTTTYAYDHTGTRVKKTVGSMVTEFRMAGSLLMSQKAGSTVTYFAYDSSGQLIGMSAGSNRYYYIRNAQNDITGIIDDTGALVVQYRYDAWGKPVSTTGSLASTIGKRNPFRYRGYYWDEETGLYYVGSRYYDPEIRRFISADDVTILNDEDRSLEHSALFPYCFNNPINYTDEGGAWPSWATKLAIGVGAIVVGAAVMAVTAATGGLGAGIAVATLKAGVAFGIKTAVSAGVVGAVSGAGIGAVSHRISTGSWSGLGKAAISGAVNGFADGFMWGGISSGITMAGMARKGVFLQKAGKLKPANKAGNGYPGIRYGRKKGRGISYRSFELHSPHSGGTHTMWHWQRNQWSYDELNNVWKVGSKKTRHWTIWGRHI